MARNLGIRWVPEEPRLPAGARLSLSDDAAGERRWLTGEEEGRAARIESDALRRQSEEQAKAALDAVRAERDALKRQVEALERAARGRDG